MRNYSNPKVSVVMTAYNSEEYINMSINSIVNQTYKNWEFVIINDHSNDGTEDILNNYKSKKIKVLNFNLIFLKSSNQFLNLNCHFF